MPLLQEKNNKKGEKFDSNRKTPRVGCLLHPLHILSKPTKKKTGTMSTAAAIAEAASRASAVGRRAADAQTETATIRVFLRASSTYTYFVDLQIAYILRTYVPNMSRLTTTINQIHTFNYLLIAFSFSFLLFTFYLFRYKWPFKALAEKFLVYLEGTL
jgi:hypothetical protein